MNARGTELTISNAASSDGGMYTVRTSALSFNRNEDSLWIPLLEHYTPLAPVTYILTEQGKLCFKVANHAICRLKISASLKCCDSHWCVVHVYLATSQYASDIFLLY